ncbi:CoA binding domain protein [Botrimarina colliarenosi]|uniref:CoA binding domain protein n=1 Tax=Botrimarina colliarenosi TaxID=2528001 RepID=A0A5C6ABF0_9BACT|nr:CoA-binding protein [Botrimarina colliarenosi]TWT96756.1 CoA binding domain protein [Botrimarina colliarenosi]
MDAPKKPTVAVIGASADRTKFGNRSLRAHAGCGYEVFAVNPKGGEIEGLPVYASIAEVPASPLDRVTMYVPPAVGLTLLDAIAAKGCGELWLNPGTESPEMIARAEALGLNPIVACSLIDCASRGA